MTESYGLSMIVNGSQLAVVYRWRMVSVTCVHVRGKNWPAEKTDPERSWLGIMLEYWSMALTGQVDVPVTAIWRV